MKHYNIKVKGRVQGVGYRYSTIRMAEQYNIKGFVKNMINGSVYIEAEGESGELQEFIKWCKRGPSMAYVDDLILYESEIKGFKKFDVKY